jgi:hypothetical protein
LREDKGQTIDVCPVRFGDDFRRQRELARAMLLIIGCW